MTHDPRMDDRDLCEIIESTYDYDDEMYGRYIDIRRKEYEEEWREYQNEMDME